MFLNQGSSFVVLKKQAYKPTGASQAVLVVKNQPGVQETQETKVWSLGWEDPLEQELATGSSILAWKIPWTDEPGRLQSMGSQRWTH